MSAPHFYKYMKTLFAIIIYYLCFCNLFAQDWKLTGHRLIIKTTDVIDPAKHLLINGSNGIFFASAYHSDSKRRVILWESTGVGLLGQDCIVSLLGNGLKVIRRGEVLNWYDMVPLMFVEMETKSTNLPLSYQNKWILDVIMIREQKLIPKN